MKPYENAVNHVLDAYDVWVQKNLDLGDPHNEDDGPRLSALSRIEKATIKTFLAYALENKEELKKHGIDFAFEGLKEAPDGAPAP